MDPTWTAKLDLVVHVQQTAPPAIYLEVENVTRPNQHILSTPTTCPQNAPPLVPRAQMPHIVTSASPVISDKPMDHALNVR